MSTGGYTKCDIVLGGLATNPQCEHGPTVLFTRGDHKFYACSAYRSRHLCSFFLDFENSKGFRNSRTKEMKRRITMTTTNPEDNQGQAQYYFSQPTLELLLQFLKLHHVTSVLCLGTPTIHENFKGSSYLLDIDGKFESSSKKFTRYNMCNHHFFASNSGYLEYLDDSTDLVVVCDPPFGARLELLFNTFQQIRYDWTERGHRGKGKLDFIFINPYFAEGKILKLNAQFGMSDYRVEYASHKKFKKGDRSPIRLFTTLNLSSLILPSPAYKFCSTCLKYVFSVSNHCTTCDSCDSRDGKTYYHCHHCGKCFKETWSHCLSCAKCHLREDSQCQSQIDQNPRKRKK